MSIMWNSRSNSSTIHYNGISWITEEPQKTVFNKKVLLVGDNVGVEWIRHTFMSSDPFLSDDVFRTLKYSFMWDYSWM